jgi:hypothetical protein
MKNFSVSLAALSTAPFAGLMITYFAGMISMILPHPYLTMSDPIEEASHNGRTRHNCA